MMIAAFLKILESISFDENLFRKEFIKTLGWVQKEDYLKIEEWMRYNQFSNKYPELLSLLVGYRS
jgi:type IV secretory pathway TrbF-like protein